MTDYYGHEVIVDRLSPAFQIRVNYTISGTSAWEASFGSGSDSGSGSGATSALVTLPIGSALSSYTFSFDAKNSTSGETYQFDVDVYEAALATTAQTIVTGPGDSLVVTGSGADTIQGAAGNDYIDGGPGADKMTGGAGDDIYIVDNAGDVIVEETGATGTETVYAYASWTMSIRLENLVIAADGPMTITGNWSNNRIDGNASANTIRGGSGDDQLFGHGGIDVLEGGDGGDILDGGAGADSMTGGAGRDEYRVDDAGDRIFESVDGDIDTVRTTLASYTLATNLEDLYLDRSAGANGYGNELGNTITGSDGADRLYGNGGKDSLNGGAGDDILIGGPGGDLMVGGDGQDTVSYVTATSGVQAMLEHDPAFFTGDAMGDAIDGFIENLTGSGFNDVLKGNSRNNVINGGAGNDIIWGGLASSDGYDTMIGGAGADEIHGGWGSLEADMLSYLGSAGGVVVNLATMAASGGDAEGDTLLGLFKDLRGGSGDDTLTGDDKVNNLMGDIGGDTIDGAGGDDMIQGGGGADVLTGGSGLDTLTYELSAAAVTVNLATGEAGGGDATGDSFSGFESLTGSNGNDTLTGDGIANRLSGRTGNDTLRGEGGDDILVGGAGGDALIGGDGSDTAAYYTATTGVRVNLRGGDAGAGDSAGDTFVSIENVTGGPHNDTLIGDDGANVISGGLGNDMLHGGGGADTLISGGGADYLNGGAGNDMLMLKGAGRETVAILQQTGHDTVSGFRPQDISYPDRLYFDLGPAFDIYEEVMAVAKFVTGVGVVMTFDQNNSVILSGTSLGSLEPDNFVFA